MQSTRRLSRFALVATLALVAIGGYTRGSGSGFGCSDRWPLCENGLAGGLLPRADYNMIVEWTHRWVAAVVGVAAIAVAVSAWRRHRERRMIVLAATAAVFVIGVQAWVGRLVVKQDLDADLVSVHLVISMTVVALFTIVLLAVSVETSESLRGGTGDRTWARLVAVAAAGSFVVLLLGSYVHNLYVGGWPLVANTVVPDLSNRFVAAHFLHRALAGILLVYLVHLAVVARRQRLPGADRRLIYAANVVYASNIGLGAAHVFTRVDSSVLVAAHLLAAALVWALLVGATVRAILASRRATVAEPPAVVRSRLLAR